MRFRSKIAVVGFIVAAVFGATVPGASAVNSVPMPDGVNSIPMP